MTSTASEKREKAAVVYNAFVAACPTRHVLATIGEKWAALLVTALADGPRRHGQLQAAIAGASQKMLTQTLRTLERDGILTRTVTSTVPLRVDYELTALGQSRGGHRRIEAVVGSPHRTGPCCPRGLRRTYRLITRATHPPTWPSNTCPPAPTRLGSTAPSAAVRSATGATSPRPRCWCDIRAGIC